MELLGHGKRKLGERSVMQTFFLLPRVLDFLDSLFSLSLIFSGAKQLIYSHVSFILKFVTFLYEREINKFVKYLPNNKRIVSLRIDLKSRPSNG